MKELRLIYLLFLLVSVYSNKLLSQAPIQFDEAFISSTQEDQFRSYLDTINKYTYINNHIVNYCLEECEALFKKDLQLSSNDKLEYALVLISSGLEKHEALKSFQLIQEHQHLLSNEDISIENKIHFSYLSAYTSFTLDDTKTAQQAFYDMYKEAKVNMDTLNMIKALYSLGQIYSDDENYSAALDNFYKVKELEEKTRSDGSSFCLIQLELSSVYNKLKETDKALELIEESLEFIDKNNIQDFKSDFLLLKGEIAYERKDFKTAQSTLDETVTFMEASESYYMLHASKIFDAKLISAQGLNNRALKIYESLLEEDNELSNKKKLEIYELAHALCNKAGYGTKAYEYLMLAKELQMEMQKNKKTQQTAYLKIKFDTAQKEKENQLLAAQVLQKQSQNKLLYALIALSVVGLFVLFGAYYQKQKFAQKLRTEVQNRTQELKYSNEELNKTNNELSEFNRILSHDLKEPLRSIVGFSNLLKKEATANSKINDYVGFIEKSGRQLHQILEDLSTFQKINDFILEPSSNVNLQKIIERTTQKMQVKYPQKSFVVNTNPLPLLFANKHVLDLVFENVIENGILFNKSEPAEVQIRYLKRDENHVFEFQDNGIGIEPEYHQRVFGMFKRLHSRKAYSGSGLGLSNTKKILEKINGTIKILKSEKDKGSIFEISFPIPNKVTTNVYDHSTAVLTA